MSLVISYIIYNSKHQIGKRKYKENHETNNDKLHTLTD